MKFLTHLLADIRIVTAFIWKQLFVRLTILLFSALALALGLAIAGNINETIHPFFFNVTAAAAEGLILGFLARLFLRDRSFGLQLTASIAMLVVGLFYLGWISWGFTGIPPLPFPRAVPDRLALVLLAAGIIGSIPALLAWRKPSAKIPSKGPARESAPRPRLVEEPVPVVVPSTPAAQQPSRNWFARVRARLPAVHWPRTRLSDIRFVGAEEHRCPYCLQPVGRRDPRGIVICPDCNTWHHRDCWSITGMCQIPHEHPV
jgi:hypothetical protein